MPVPENSKQISRFSMREEVYNTLLKWVMEGVLLPGEKILDKDLASRLGVSRTPVREALRRLEDKELIVSSANRWTKVADVSLEEPERIYPIIWTLEELALSLVFPDITNADIKQMGTINKMMKKAVEDKDPVKASWADVEFHRVYIEKTKNYHLVSILDDLKVKYRRVEITYFSGSDYATDSLSEHDRILEALEEKNLNKALEQVRLNWQNSMKRIRAIGEKRKGQISF